MKTQRTAFLKKAALFFLIPALILSRPTAVFAADCNPECYIMSMVLRCLGVATYTEVGQWVAAYEGYLESTGNQALLTQLKGYRSAPWGSTVKGINPLYQSVREWLFKASVYGPDANGNYVYTLPSKSAPLPSSAFGVAGFQGTRFTDVNIPSNASGYTYCFSDAYTAGSYYIRRNLYAPSGVEVFAVTDNFSGYIDKVVVHFYVRDASSSNFYKQISLKRIGTAFRPSDWSVAIKDTSFQGDVSYCNTTFTQCMNLPIKVFSSAYYATKYCKTGVVEGLFGKNTASLWSRGESWGTDLSLKDRDVSFVGDTLTLPPNASEAHQLCGSNFGKTLEGLSSEMERLNKFSIHYQAGYRVEHYKQVTVEEGVEREWEQEEAETLTGIAGKTANLTPKEYAGFLYSPSLTSPQGPTVSGDGNLVVKLYYARRRYPYRVEHYLQSGYNAKGEPSWKQEESEERTGYFEGPVTYSEKTYPGYRYAPDLTDPGGDIIPLDGNVTVRLYYRQVTAMDTALDTASQSFKKTVSSAEQSVMPILKAYIPIVAAILLLFLIYVIYRNIFYQVSSTKKDSRHSGSSGGNASQMKKMGRETSLTAFCTGVPLWKKQKAAGKRPRGDRIREKVLQGSLPG